MLASLTDQAGKPAELERQDRARASAEDRVRCAKQTALENLPARELALNEVWLERSRIASDLTVWTQALTLDGELATCEPKTLRYRLLHTAARLAFHARHATLRIQPGPGASELAAAGRLTNLDRPARIVRATPRSHPLTPGRVRCQTGPPAVAANNSASTFSAICSSAPRDGK